MSNLFNFPLYLLTGLLHDWIALKDNQVLNTSVCNSKQRPILTNILTISSPLNISSSACPASMATVVISSSRRNFHASRFIFRKTALSETFFEEVNCFFLGNMGTYLSFYHISRSITNFLSPILSDSAQYRHKLHSIYQANESNKNDGFGIVRKQSIMSKKHQLIWYGEVGRRTTSSTELWTMHGAGAYYHTSGSGTFEGHCIYGHRNGPGKFSFSDGDIVNGIYLDNEMSQGIMTCKNGNVIYSGRWIDLYPTDGNMTFINGDQYDGNFGTLKSDSVPHGEGVMKYANGDVYTGLWSFGRKSGFGEMVCLSGERYVGNWRADKYFGEGTLTYKNGDVYEGRFHAGEKTGYGVLKCINGDTYKGYWLKDKMHGAGQFVSSPGGLGDSYSGEWSCDKKHGVGTLFCSDGDIYTGQWADGVKHGEMLHRKWGETGFKTENWERGVQLFD